MKRPEDVTFGGHGGATIRGRVALVSPLGSEQHVSVAISAGEIVVRVPKATRLAAGDLIEFGVDPDRLHVFDQATGQSLGTS